MHQLPFTALLNKLLAGPVTAMLTALGVHVAHPQAPIANYVAMQIFVFLFALLLFIILRASLSVDNPGFVQHMFEGVHGFIGGQGREIIGHHHTRFDSYLATLGIFILLSNLLGLIPGFEAPTSIYFVPFGCAVVTWFYYHFQGIRANGAGYIKHFFGPIWPLAPLMFVIEVFSHLARMMSLTIRLYANIFAGDMVTMAFFSLVPIGIPLLFIGLHIGVSFIQTYIFVLLATVYLAEATAHEH
jgi:F-type H+-transporting ATPase subunit a